LNLASDLKGDLCPTVHSVAVSSNLISSLGDMLATSLQAVAVVDTKDSGRIVSVLSISDFRGITEPMILSLAGLSVGEFLRNKSNTPAIMPEPITCTRDRRLFEVVLVMLELRLHRIFVVDDELHPVDVVTFTDIIACVYRAERDSVHV
jgi:CBS domain-containing protein